MSQRSIAYAPTYNDALVTVDNPATIGKIGTVRFRWLTAAPGFKIMAPRS